MKKTYYKYLFPAVLATVIFSISLHAGTSGLWPTISTSAIAKKNNYNLSQSRLFPKTLMYIQRNYVEPNRINPKEMFKGSLDRMQTNIPEILIISNSQTSFTIIIDKAKKKFSSSLRTLGDFWQLMKKIFIFIELNYKGEVELKDIESIAIDGALKTLDPHSALFTPEFYKEFKIDTGGQFGGLGIVITSKDGQLTVIAPIEGTPAWRAGLKSGDVITEINNDSTINMSLMKAVDRLRGKVGSKVNITVERKSKNAPFHVTLTRAKIQIDSIKESLIKDEVGDVGYIKVKRFQKGTARDFYKELKQLQSESGSKFKGLIIDMRNNPGGLLNEAVNIADAFLDNGVIVSTVGAHKKFIEKDVAHVKGTESELYPIVVLVNEGSASASEIVAGALSLHNRALIVGQNTFGKGSVQSIYELGGDYALKLTIAQYLTAGKQSIQTVGIAPDITLAAATIDKELLDIVPNKPSSEKELTKHLKQILPIAEKSKKIISFYKPYVDEEDMEEMRRKEYSNNLEFKDDFAVKLATRVILAAKTSNPNELIKESVAVLNKLTAQEEEKISAKLIELGTNWSSGTGKSKLALDVKSKIKQGNSIVQRASAGEDAKLVLSVTNRGKKSLHKLIGIIESENPLLDEKEFVFGKVAPGQTASRELKIKLPHSVNNRNIPFEVHFKRGTTLTKLTYSSALKVSELERPRFSFKYHLGKPKTVGAPHPLPRGKSVPLNVKIKNVGKGSTKEANIYISNKKNINGLFIEKGRVNLEKIKPGETKNATFSFRITPAMTTSTFVLELVLGDRDLLEFVTTDLNITLQSGSISPQPGIWYEGPKIELANKSFPIITSSDKATLKGKITDDTAIKDFYIFVGENKVAYRSNPHESTTLDFVETFKIEKGNNNISIIARDINNLSSRRSVVIQKGRF
jgi:carboxyl-terminal processing protease